MNKQTDARIAQRGELCLRVDDERPPPCVAHDDGIFDARYVVGQALQGPGAECDGVGHDLGEVKR
jgi:hypothetical protein